MKTQDFIVRTRVTTATLQTWVEAGWLLPQRVDQAHDFTDMDVARARLIRDLKHDMGVNDEGIAIILGLVDQMHGLRHTLRQVLRVPRAKPRKAQRITRSPRRGA
jgi:chaperone modulatory protein CbpM